MKHESGLTLNQLAERNATLVTEIEKCRELSGCPAGVDLQDWLKQLAAENVGLTEFITQSCYVFDGEQHEISDAYICATDGGMPETPATDRIVAEAEARGVEKFAAEQRGVAERLKTRGGGVVTSSVKFCLTSAEEAEDFAKQLREGADK
ncbi:hypothetical protein [Klebsiella aerogenes]|uniref:hypothetical protein n=1 Tax=Klebsiella aerogenes TaxID=548 RepID=UPI002FF73872